MSKQTCQICPRECHINRSENLGYCGRPNKIYISKVMLHKFEEPCISGPCSPDKNMRGSGAIFFSGCNLKCIYCQNYNISQQEHGKTVSVKKLADLFKKLEAAGAYNINLVTPTHYTAQIIRALKLYKPQIPVVWNSSGYEKASTIKKLKGLVDIFLIDFKYMDNNLSLELSNAPEYAKYAKETILEAKKIAPNNIFSPDGIMQKGIIIRHLCLPNCTNDSKRIIDWIKENLGTDTIISLMSQYVPCFKAKNNKKINRPLRPVEYKILVNYLIENNFNDAYTQELSSGNTCYTPDFDDNSWLNI